MKKKISKIKYALMNIDSFCPECHKCVPNKVNGKYFIPASLKGWGDSYTNTCPYCGYSFDNTELLMFPHTKQYFPDAPDALCDLLDDSFFMTLNCNDCFGPACCWDEEIEEDVLTLYYVLVSKEGMKPSKALDAIKQWVAGKLFFSEKRPSKELKQLRKLTGWEWFPQEYKK